MKKIRIYKSDLFILCLLLTVSHLWSFTGVSNKVYKLAELFLLAYILLFFLLNHKKLKHDTLLFSKYVWLFLLLPVPSIFISYFVHGQSLSLSFYMFRYELIWFLYFVLHIYRPSSSRVLGVVVCFGVIWAAALLFQQFTYPDFWFAQRGGDDIGVRAIEVRNGIYRFMTIGYSVAALALYYSMQKAVLGKCNRWKWSGVFVVCLLGVYLLMTRQLIAATAVTLALSNLVGRSNISMKRVLTTFILIICICIVYEYREFFLGDLVSRTVKDLEANVRYDSVKFYLFEYWKSPFCFLFGNGVAHDSSFYGVELSRYEQLYGFYRSDIGIIGVLNTYGILYVLVFVLFTANLFLKNFSRLELYQKLFFISVYLPIIMIFPFANLFFTAAFVLALYLSDITLQNVQISLSK